MRHILEVRLKKRMFSFMDFRGKMIEEMTVALGATQVKAQNNGTRFDIADDELKNLYFFSFENFGFQSELSASFDDLPATASKLLSAIKGFSPYKLDSGLLRIGTKSIVLFHRKNDNLELIKDAYKSLLVNNHERLSSLTKSDIIDTAHTFELKLQNTKANVLTGPVTKEEAVEKFFDGEIGKRYKEQFTRDNGMLLSIDVASGPLVSINDIDSLTTQIDLQAKNIKTIFEGFKSLFSTIE